LWYDTETRRALCSSGNASSCSCGRNHDASRLRRGLVVCFALLLLLLLLLLLQVVTAAVARLLQSFSFALEPGQVPVRVKQTFALIPAQGLRVRVHRRRSP
jgi:hypothetical protein